jgi:hypothetical protein
MSLGGADSLGEELYFWGAGAAALRRGYNALLFEIPGQRGAMYSNRGVELFYRWDTGLHCEHDIAVEHDLALKALAVDSAMSLAALISRDDWLDDVFK